MNVSYLSGNGRVDHVVGIAIFCYDGTDVFKFPQELTFKADHLSSMNKRVLIRLIFCFQGLKESHRKYCSVNVGFL